MDIKALQDEVGKRLPLDRFEHVLRVAETAKQLAELHGESVKDAEIAALLHDVAKFTKKEELREVLLAHHCDQRLLVYHHELWHGPVGAIVAKQEFGVTQENILRAIQFHTTGRANMSRLEKVIYIADLIEPGRKFPGIEQLREQLSGDLDTMMKACIHHTVQFLVSKKVAIYPDSMDCYNEYMMKEGK